MTTTDGFADVAIGEPGAESPLQGWVHVLYGTGAGLTATAPADQIWSPSVAGVAGGPHLNGFFGRALG